MEQEKVVIFKINNNYYGTKLAIVNEIMNTDKISITDLPNHKHTNIEGVSHIRGKVCTIVNGHKLLDMEKTLKYSTEKIIILGQGEAALLVDDVIEIVDVNENLKHVITNHEMQGDYRHIDYLIEYNDVYVTVMNIEGMVLPKKEIKESV